ncbi:MAG: M15 family metallopeptidase [Cyanobacteria bacterium J069]|nr:MAG: D-alanyl-D-alanine dipeptidase [Cyanobacteria bacterium J069]
MKPYQQVAIADCGEPLVEIPPAEFGRVVPHPYVALGAPYGDRSPFFVRLGVLEGLRLAQAALRESHPGWGIQIFDAYRPVAVQQFMVDYTFQDLVRSQGLDSATLSASQQHDLWQQVYQFWAVPNPDPAMPPPHSTGAAVDVTLLDASGQPADMGSPIDELSPRSYPDHFAPYAEVESPDYDPVLAIAHTHRQLLATAMQAGGFYRHPHEWWHFSIGDQLWAWLKNQEAASEVVVARYGAA